jgi:hypothetical protein
MSRPGQRFIIPGPLPYPPPLRRNISFPSYDIYEYPNIPTFWWYVYVMYVYRHDNNDNNDHL